MRACGRGNFLQREELSDAAQSPLLSSMVESLGHLVVAAVNEVKGLAGSTKSSTFSKRVVAIPKMSSLRKTRGDQCFRKTLQGASQTLRRLKTGLKPVRCFLAGKSATESRTRLFHSRDSPRDEQRDVE